MEAWTVNGVSDTELAQHYFEHTVDSFAATSTRPEQTNTWRAVLPAIAYSSPALRRGILTLAAMHLHFTTVDDPEAAEKYLAVAEHHGEIFVRESRRQIRELNPSEIDSALACSKLLGILGLIFYHVHRRNGAAISDSAAWTWLQLIRGVKPVNVAVFEASQQVNPAFAKDLLPEVALPGGIQPPSEHPVMPCGHPLLSIVRDSWPERFAALQRVLAEYGSVLSQSEARDSNNALDLLNKVSQHLFSGQVHSIFRTCITWPSIVPKGFLEMLLRCSPVALAIYAHWLLLFILIEDYWWINSMGRDGILEISDMLSGEGPEIQMLQQWPRHIAGMDRPPISPQDASIDPMLL